MGPLRYLEDCLMSSEGVGVVVLFMGNHRVMLVYPLICSYLSIGYFYIYVLISFNLKVFFRAFSERPYPLSIYMIPNSLFLLLLFNL